MKRVFIAGALALAAATQAFAADLPPAPAPMPRAPAAYVPVAPAWSWTGFYVGMNTGYGFGNSTWSQPAASSGGFAVDGWMVGATVGGNYQIGQLVLGLEGDYDWQNIRGASNTSPCFNLVGAGLGGGCATSSNWVATFRGRVGYAFDRILLYGTGGGAATDIRSSTATLPWASATEFGWTAGAGIEVAITDNVTAKMEYLYADFGNSSCSSAANCGFAAPSTVSLTENMVRLGINYKFGY